MTTIPSERGRASSPWWTWLGLLVLLLFAAWWRGHTFGPSIEARTGWTLWPQMRGSTEPLDCDEAAYGYIGRRLSEGQVMYRDLTENKPPGGYWLFALAVKLGGSTELTIRAMPVPLIGLTIVLIFWIGQRVSRPSSGLIAGFVFTLLCTDPYLHGNGANLEHAMNLFAVASLAAVIASWKGRRGWLVVAGILVGCSTLVKQVGALAGSLYALSAWYRVDTPPSGSRVRSWMLDLLALAVGFSAVWVLTIAVLVGQGAGPDAWHDIIKLGSAIASAPDSPNQPTFLIRWFTGNADSNDGRLPWPFGKPDDWILWWGQGSYPVWIAAVPGLLILGWKQDNAPRRLVAFWTLLAWVEVALPRMFWAHYYLLPTPGVALAVGVGASETLSAVKGWIAHQGAKSGLAPGPSATSPERTESVSLNSSVHQARGHRFATVLARSVLAIGFLMAIVSQFTIQVRDYLLTRPESLTKYKSGLQWIADRQIGQLLARRTSAWDHPTLYVWGWQSPLYFYSGMNCPTRHFFPNDWILSQVGRNNPLVDRFLDETMRDLKANPPLILFLGTLPFPDLRDFVTSRYVPSRLMTEGPFPLLWVRKDHADAFDRDSFP